MALFWWMPAINVERALSGNSRSHFPGWGDLLSVEISPVVSSLIFIGTQRKDGEALLSLTFTLSGNVGRLHLKQWALIPNFIPACAHWVPTCLSILIKG